MAQKGTIERTALGRVANLGDLYDVRTDTFCGISMLKKSPPEVAVTLQDNFKTEMKFIVDDSMSDQFSKMDITAELQVSLLAGLFTLDGSGKYLSDKKTSKKAVHASMLYNVTTNFESLNLFNDELKEYISIDALRHDEATHVVVKVQWGANSLLKVKDENQNNEDRTQVAGMLGATLKKAALQISGKAEVQYGEGDAGRQRNFSFEIFGDLLPKSSEKMPNTFDEAVAMMQDLPSLVRLANQGKGKQIRYILFPISSKPFREHLGNAEISDRMLKDLAQSSIAYFVELFSEILSCLQEVNDILEDAKYMEMKCACVGRKMLQKLNELKTEMTVGEARLRYELAEKLQKVRSGKEEMSVLDKLRSDYLGGEQCAPKLRDACIDLFKTVETKIEFAKLCNEYGVTYVISRKMVENAIVRNDHVVVFYASEESRSDADKWSDNKTAFFTMIKESAAKKEPVIQYFFVDCDFDLDTGRLKGTRVEKYEKQRCVNKDMLLRDVVEVVNPMTLVSDNFVPFFIACPCSPDNKRCQWYCGRCEERLQFHVVDSHVYCTCIRTPAARIRLRCNDPQHGVSSLPVTYEMLRILRPHGETYELSQDKTQLTILLFGEAGVGKSTLVNGLANYLTFGSLDEAAAAGGLFPAPQRFSYVDPDTYRTREISTAQFVETPGDYPLVHTFAYDRIVVNAVECPGLGRSGVNDKSLVENTLKIARSFKTVDAVCVVLNSNQTQPSAGFSHAVSVVLNALNASAFENNVFCFTNAKLTNHRPGDALNVLQSELKADRKLSSIGVSSRNVFCVENEPVKYLAEVKNGIRHDPEDKRSIESSWGISTTTAAKMIQYVMSLKPVAGGSLAAVVQDGAGGSASRDTPTRRPYALLH